MKPVRTPQTAQAAQAARQAVALAYGGGDGAPRVVASGSGFLAEKIIATAQEHGVFVHRSRELVGLLMQVELDREIPPAMYRAIAELLAWLYAIEAGGEAGPAPAQATDGRDGA